MLPLYAFYSVVRIFVAYLLSLTFAVGYGYIAAYNPRVEAFMIAVLDILQSIPVLSFLPAVMLAMISLIPGRQLGIEMGAILLIFTGQVWNMAFSFYSSLKSLPRELREAARVFRFSAWQRFWQLELPYSAIGLVWNSMVSVAGGWFFLMACEMFVLGDRDFRLPGLGSYLQTAASTGDSHGMLWGSVTMILIIVATDQLVWRPVIAWADKFKFEQGESTSRKSSPILYALQNSNALGWLKQVTLVPASERIYVRLARRQRELIARPTHEPRKRSQLAAVLFIAAGTLLVAFAAFRALELLRHVHGAEIVELVEGGGRDVSSRERCLADRVRLDHPDRRRHRLSSPLGQNRPATGADRRVLPGDGDLSYPADCPGSAGVAGWASGRLLSCCWAPSGTSSSM